ncbi:MAG: hypothetical protein WAW37_03480 [Syntrophobacteraceae bacterium]
MLAREQVGDLHDFGVDVRIFSLNDCMLVKEKLRVLYLWSSEEEAKRVISELTGTGVEFEATLVKSESEFVSSLLRKKFDVIIVDGHADFHLSGSDHLAAFEIARELIPNIPFVLIGESRSGPGESERAQAGCVHIPRQELHLLGSVIQKALLHANP